MVITPVTQRKHFLVLRKQIHYKQHVTSNANWTTFTNLIGEFSLIFRLCGVELNNNGLLQVESQPADFLLTIDFYSDAENELTGFHCYLSGQSRAGLTTPAPPPGATWGPEIGALRPGERACGIRNVNALNANATAKEEDRIVNGWETAKHEYPWQVYFTQGLTIAAKQNLYDINLKT